MVQMLSNHNASQHSSLLKILVVKQQKYKQIDLEYFQTMRWTEMIG